LILAEPRKIPLEHQENAMIVSERAIDDPLLSDEPTIELVTRARGGDRPAMEALLQRCLPPLKRWAHGRLPAAARGRLDTGDLVH